MAGPKGKGGKASSSGRYDRFMSHLAHDEDVHAFFDQSKNIQLLTPEEEKDLLYKAIAGDPDAKKALVYHNLKFIIRKAKAAVRRHYSTAKPSNSLFLEAISAGCIGMMKAIDEFNPDKKCKLITYAAWHIEDNIRKIILFEVNSTKPAKALSQVKHVNINVSPISHFEGFDKEDNDLPHVVDAIENNINNTKLREALVELEPTERLIIGNRYGLAGNTKTYNDIADDLGMSVDDVRNIEHQALRKLFLSINEEAMLTFLYST